MNRDSIYNQLFCNNSSSAANLSRYAKGIDRGDVTQNGLASLVKWMWNCSPSIALIMPSNTLGNSLIIESLVNMEVPASVEMMLIGDSSRVVVQIALVEAGGCG